MDIKTLAGLCADHADSTELVVYNETNDTSWAVDDAIEDDGKLVLILREEMN